MDRSVEIGTPTTIPASRRDAPSFSFEEHSYGMQDVLVRSFLPSVAFLRNAFTVTLPSLPKFATKDLRTLLQFY